jgi:hypothetical protein
MTKSKKDTGVTTPVFSFEKQEKKIKNKIVEKYNYFINGKKVSDSYIIKTTGISKSDLKYIAKFEKENFDIAINLFLLDSYDLPNYFEVNNFTRSYKTKKSIRNYQQSYYFLNGKRISEKKISELTGLEPVAVQYLSKYSPENFNESIGKAQKGSYTLSLDLNDIEEVLEGYTDLENRNMTDFVVEIRNFIDNSKQMPFLSSLKFEVEVNSKLVYFDFSESFKGDSHKKTRGESEFAVYSS